jgi:hypothetical protein
MAPCADEKARRSSKKPADRVIFRGANATTNARGKHAEEMTNAEKDADGLSAR